MFPATPNWFDQLINFNVTWNVVWLLHIFHLAATTVYWYHLEYERYFFLGHVVFWRMLFMRALSTIIPPFSFHSIPPYFHHYFLNWENYCSICIYIYCTKEKEIRVMKLTHTYIYIYYLGLEPFLCQVCFWICTLPLAYPILWKRSALLLVC